MSYHRSRLRCDRCGVSLDLATSRPVRTARRIAEGFGWRVARAQGLLSPLLTDLDYCRTCKSEVKG